MNPATGLQLRDDVRVFGDSRREDGRCIISFDGFVNYRAESTVEVSEGRVKLSTDLFGVQKLYYAFDGAQLLISGRFKEFADRPVDPALRRLQLLQGFIPYPFTVLKGVFKSPPGAEILFTRTGPAWQSEYRLDAWKRSLSGPAYDVQNFKRDFVQAIEDQKRTCHRNVVIALSGGFDSMLLGHLFREHLAAVSHYAETEADADALRERVRGFLPDIPWSVFCADDDIPEDAARDYFDAVDEPCCDPAGLAEYLMLRKLRTSGMAPDDSMVLNGQWADTEFAGDRLPFKEHLLDRFFGGAWPGLSFRKKVRTDTWTGKIMDYFKSTRTRFYDSYTQHEPLPPEYQRQIDRVYQFYRDELGLSRANFFGLVDFLLYTTNCSIEKMKTESRALRIRHLAPFLDPVVASIAFRIDAKHKVGYRSGKKILKRTFPEVHAGLYRSGAFIPGRFWQRVAGSRQVSDYFGYFFREWLERNGKHA